MVPEGYVSAPMRGDLPPLPDRVKALPVGPNGYPVPYFVTWVGDKPDFRAADGRAFARCVKQRLCWVCGQSLGYLTDEVAFVCGPIAASNKISSEPPSHVECAEFACRACPFLVRPHAKRRPGFDDELEEHRSAPSGLHIEGNPGVSAVWVTRWYSMLNLGKGGVLLKMGDPERVSWFCQGRAATRAEVERGVEVGLPAVVATATGPGDREALESRLRVLRNLMPES